MPPSDQNTITVVCFDRTGKLVDRIEGVSLGDRREAAAQGRESLHTAALWGALAAHGATRAGDTPQELLPS